MSKKIIIDASFPEETRVALLDKNNNIENIEISSSNRKHLKGNIYLGKITRVEPSLQAAFVDYGNEKAGFLPFSEIHPDYYYLLNKDKKEQHIVGSELETSQITSEDLQETKPGISLPDEIILDQTTLLVEGEINPDININACEDDIDILSEEVDNSEQRRFKIQEVIKKGQILLVQVTKEERGNKGAALTTYISLAGKYCVLMPNTNSQNGISRKISNIDERKRLKRIINELSKNNNSKTYSIIARTAGLGHTTIELKKDYDYLARLWNKIRETTLKCSAPSFIHQEDGILLKTIRDMFDHNVKEFLVQGKNAYHDCLKFAEEMMPTYVKKIKEYKNKSPIFIKYGIEEQLANLYQPIVHLPSGGYIVINPTEALISIDVNSGKATSENNIEEMALKTNIEAAKEIAKQSRLRDLSGLIVIDFIDLSESKNKKLIERYLWEAFSRDKARIQTSSISNFGLLEMSRQRLKPSFLEMNSDICEHCSGKGIVRNKEANAMLILRTIENELHNSSCYIVNVYAVASSILTLLNEKRTEISLIEQKHNIKLNFYIDRDATSDSYSIEKIKTPAKNSNIEKEHVAQLDFSSEIYNTIEQKQQITDNTDEIVKSEKQEDLPQRRKKIHRNRRKIIKSKKESKQSTETNDKPQ
ncbi:MAG: Rne/Rng family ribonuclease [Rickettsiaceae bacterium]|nr:Rne/Rng family ribonuclease [Rickettsiaceae bacterium]